MIKGWKRSTLGEACVIEKGKASAANEPPGSYPLITTGAERKSSATWQFEGPAVCIPMISAYGHGKPGLKHVHYQEGKFALANILSALLVKNSEELSAKFLSVFLNFYKDHLIVPLQFGAANMSITAERLATVPVWYPSLTEQQRILCLLDEAEQLRKLRGQAGARMEEFVPALFHEMFGDPVSNTMGWKITKLEELGVWRSGGTPSRTKPEYFSGNIPWLSSGELGQMYTSSSEEYITEEAIKNSNAAKIEIGSLLLGMYDTAALNSTITEVMCACNQAIAYSKLDENSIDTAYAYYAIQIGKEHFRRLRRGIRQKNLNLSMIRGISIPLPPLALQQEFAQRVQEARGVQSVQARSEERIEALYQSMLSRAFAGEL